MTKRGIVLALLWLPVAGALAPAPLAADHAEPVFEAVARGYETGETAVELPKRLTVLQVVGTECAGLDPLGIAAGLVVEEDGESVPTALGRIVATVHLIREDGSRVKLGRFRTRPDEDHGVFGSRIIQASGGLRTGDLLRWTLKFRRFPPIPGGREIELLMGIVDPAFTE